MTKTTKHETRNRILKRLGRTVIDFGPIFLFFFVAGMLFKTALDKPGEWIFWALLPFQIIAGILMCDITAYDRERREMEKFLVAAGFK